MKKNRTIIMVLFFFMGLLVLLYPSISDFYNQKVMSKEIGNYEEILKEFTKDTLTIETEEKNIEIERKNISIIKIVYNW